MLFRTLFEALNRGRARTSARPARLGPARIRPAAFRLGVEALGDRIVPASLSVGDATILEGNTGVQYAEVRVTLDAPTTKTVTVNYGTADGTATTAANDYVATSGKLTFAPGEISKTILVPVIGDRLGEPNENFLVKLHGAKNANVADGTGVVTIVDDEPRISISDVSQLEGNSGTTLFTFTVSLSAAYDQAVTVNYATADGTATTANNDYLAAFGTLTFAAGETTKTITVEVIGNATPEPDKTFYVNLRGASTNALVARGQGVGTILDDDGWVPEPPPGEGCTCGTEGDPYDPGNPSGIAP